MRGRISKVFKLEEGSPAGDKWGFLVFSKACAVGYVYTPVLFPTKMSAERGRKDMLIQDVRWVVD